MPRKTHRKNAIITICPIDNMPRYLLSWEPRRKTIFTRHRCRELLKNDLVDIIHFLPKISGRVVPPWELILN